MIRRVLDRFRDGHDSTAWPGSAGPGLGVRDDFRNWLHRTEDVRARYARAAECRSL